MTFWSGELLEERVNAERIITPFQESLIDCNAYTLRMGGEVYVTPDVKSGMEIFSSKKKLNRKKVEKLPPNEHFIIPPGQFAWLLTKEYIRILTNTMSFISLKSKFKFKGLINVSGFHVDPGYEGHLVYAVYNAGPQEIRLSEDEPLFLIWFSSLDRDSKKVRKNQHGLWNKAPLKGIKTDFLVPGEILSLQSLSKEISTVRQKVNNVYIYGTVFGAVIFLLPRINEMFAWIEKLKT